MSAWMAQLSSQSHDAYIQCKLLYSSIQVCAMIECWWWLHGKIIVWSFWVMLSYYVVTITIPFYSHLCFNTCTPTLPSYQNWLENTCTFESQAVLLYSKTHVEGDCETRFMPSCDQNLHFTWCTADYVSISYSHFTFPYMPHIYYWILLLVFWVLY